MTMDRTSKLVDLTLVSKYYPPMANFSYPRNETANDRDQTSGDRRSVGSDSSAPGLTDDRTDSEVSADDDYQHHWSGEEAEIWDSFWGRGIKGKKEDFGLTFKAQYPALIPSPQRRRNQRVTCEAGQRNSAWPLPEGSPIQGRNRQPAASYSPFPKPISLPARSPASPSWESSRPRGIKTPEQPRRPPRPDERLLTPCINQQASPVKAVFTVKSEGNLRNSAISRRDNTSVTTSATSATTNPTGITGIAGTTDTTTTNITVNTNTRRSRNSRAPPRPESTEPVRPKTAVENRPPTPFEVEFPMTLQAAVSRSAAHLPLPEPPKERTSMLTVRTSRYRNTATPEPSPELHSVFEDDSDSEREEEGRRSFFRFHRRSGSDLRRSARSESEAPRRRRREKSRPGTSASVKESDDSSSARPSTPDKDKSQSGRKRGLSKILGRSK